MNILSIDCDWTQFWSKLPFFGNPPGDEGSSTRSTESEGSKRGKQRRAGTIGKTIVDLKTTTRMPSRPTEAQKRQMALYSMAYPNLQTNEFNESRLKQLRLNKTIEKNLFKINKIKTHESKMNNFSKGDVKQTQDKP